MQGVATGFEAPADGVSVLEPSGAATYGAEPTTTVPGDEKHTPAISYESPSNILGGL